MSLQDTSTQSWETSLYGRPLTTEEHLLVDDLFASCYLARPGHDLCLRFYENLERSCAPLERLETLRAILGEFSTRLRLDHEFSERHDIWSTWSA